MFRKVFPFVIALVFCTSCIISSDSPVETSSNDVNLLQRGDIVVSNINTDSIVLLDQDGNFKATLVDSPVDSTLLLTGVHFDQVNREIIYIHDSTVNANDAIKAISLYEGEVRTILRNNQLQGVLPAVARLSSGDLVVVESTATAEKFNANGIRQGAPFMSGSLIATVADLSPINSGGFVACSSATTNTVRTHNAAGVVQATATSASPLPTLGALAATSCVQDQASGVIYVAYSGATDAVRAYNSSLTTVLWTFTDTNIFTTPGKISLRPNGNILVSDTAFHHIVEIDTNGALVQVLGGTVLNNPGHIAVVK